MAKTQRVLNLNLRVLKKSNHEPATGDVFSLCPMGQFYLHGRVVSTVAKIGPMEGCILIYIFKTPSKSKDEISDLSPEHLLVPPILTNKLPWAKGFFEFLRNESLKPQDRLKVHCFKDTRGWYFDEYGNRLSDPAGPVGQWGLHSYRTIDDEVSKALGIPLAPD